MTLAKIKEYDDAICGRGLWEIEGNGESTSFVGVDIDPTTLKHWTILSICEDAHTQICIPNMYSKSDRGRQTQYDVIDMCN